MTVREYSPLQEAEVLLVDDRAPNLMALEAALEPLGVKLLRANSGEEALHYLLERDVATIVLDVQMPGMDGYETAALIKARAATRDIPIIFLTALSHDVEHQLLGYDVGATDYVCKPVEPAVLRAKVRAFVDLSSRMRATELLNQELDTVVRELRERLAEFEGCDDDSRVVGMGLASLARTEQVLEMDFDCDVRAPGTVRAAARSALASQPDELRDRVVLLMSELVTNAVAHAASGGTARLEIGNRLLRGEVSDRSARVPDEIEYGERDDGGRGLILLTQLAQRCGLLRTPTSKTVWFEIDPLSVTP